MILKSAWWMFAIMPFTRNFRGEWEDGRSRRPEADRKRISELPNQEV